MTSIFILYNGTINTIIAEPIENATDETMVKTFTTTTAYLTKHGFHPVFNIIDNVASKAIREYLDKEDIGIQLVEPRNHRVSTAERAIQTFKTCLWQD